MHGDKRIPISSQTGTRDWHSVGYKVMDGRLCSSPGLHHIQSGLPVSLYFNNKGSMLQIFINTPLNYKRLKLVNDHACFHYLDRLYLENEWCTFLLMIASALEYVEICSVGATSRQWLLRQLRS